jgi:ubiquinone/menaquinone biosynthesis C-methylase UbiE
MAPNDTTRSESFADSYDRKAEGCNWRGPEVAFGLLYEFVSAGESILDIGIGTGLSSTLFHKAGLRVFGIDRSAEMLDTCRQKGFATDLRQHDLIAEPYPYDSASMDLAVCIAVLDFFEDKSPVFREAARILRDRGTFVFAVTDREPSQSVQYTANRDSGQPDSTMTFYRRSEKEIHELLRQHSFEPLKFVGFTVFMNPDGTDPLDMKAYLARRML